jgi:hypothetical protein
MNKTRTAWVLSAISALASSALAPVEARANGRFPFAQHVIVGPNATSNEIVLRATFGLLWSRDGGRTFDWACEQSIGFSGNWDPPMVFGSNRLVVGLPDGLVSTPDGCDFALNASVPNTSILDIAASRDTMTIYAVENIPVVANRVFASVDGGATWSVRGLGPANVSFDTVELAPSDARRVYLSGLDGSTRAPVVFRSSDGAATMTPSVLPAESLFNATGAFVSGVGQTDPNLVYVRVDRDGGTHLLRSRDGGQSWSIVFRAAGELRGFALADDGRVWVGGAMDGLKRSDDAGETWTSVNAPAPFCLRHHDGALYICVDWVREPYALGRLRDGSATIEPLLRFQDARGAFSCAASSSAQTECAPRWPQQRMVVTTRSASDASTDDAADAAMDANEPARDAAMDARADAATTPPTNPSCHCAAPAAAVRWSGASLWIALAAIALRRRRRSSSV